MRNFILCIMVITLVFMSAPAAQGATAVVNVDGKQVHFDVDPINDKGRLLVPMRPIFEALGAIVNWDEKNQTIMAGKADTLITMKIGQVSAQKNQEQIKLDSAPRLVRWRTMVPLRFIGESLGATVVWDPKTKTVEITSPKLNPPVVTPPAKNKYDETPTDLASSLGSLFGNIGGFSSYKYTAVIQNTMIEVGLQMDNPDGVQKWQNTNSETRSAFLAKLIDQLRVWYPEKDVINVVVSYTNYEEKRDPESGDIKIRYNGSTGRWEVKQVVMLGSANYFKSMDFTDISPFE